MDGQHPRLKLSLSGCNILFPNYVPFVDFFFVLAEVQTPSLCVSVADESQVEGPDQHQMWSLQLEIFFDKFFQEADKLEMIRKAQGEKTQVI